MLNRWSTWLLVGALGLMPVLLLSTESGGSTAYYVLLVGSLLIIFDTFKENNPKHGLSPYVALLIAFALPLLATLSSMALHGNWTQVNLERSLRLAIGAPLLLIAMLRVDARLLRQALWGVILAGWTASIIVLQLALSNLAERPATKAYNAVTYGNLMLLLAAITLYSLAIPLTRHVRLERTIKIVTVLATFSSFVLTQTRTGWMAMPVFIMLGIIVYSRRIKPTYVAAAVIGVMALTLTLGALSPHLRDRTELITAQTAECMNIDTRANTSICVRLQLWRSALDMLQSAPFTGVGSGSAFQAHLRQYQKEGRISEYVAFNYGEPHNDMLDALALYGIPGGLALLMIYFVPGVIFLRRLRVDLPQPIRIAAAMGAATCLGFAVFGLTELMFRGMRTLGFYVVLVTFFMALSDTRINEAKTLPPTA